MTPTAIPLPSREGRRAAPPPRSPKLSVEEVSQRYGATTALDRVGLDVAEGEVLCLLGPSGSGKSTLLRLIAGIERPTGGRIVLDGIEVAGPRRFVEPERRHVGMVFQDYALFPHLTVAANVAFGLRERSRPEVHRLVGSMLDRVGLAPFAASYPHMLSGGERQRVALARALAPGPRVLLMDEPFSSLDDRLREGVRRDTMALLRDTGTTTIVVTHDPDEAMRIADRIALLHQGRLEQCGRPEELYAQPSTMFAARFFSDINEVCGVCRHGRVHTPLGSCAAPHLAEQATASVCIRPQHVRLTTGERGIRARVLSTVYLGEIDQVSLAVNGLDRPLTLRALGPTGMQPGDTVHLEVRPEDMFLVPHDHTSRALHGPTPGVAS